MLVALRRALLAAILAAVVAAEEVQTLTDASFQSSVQGSPSLWLVKFYAPWCGHCKKLAPVLEKFAADIKPTELGEGVRVGKVDCTEHSSLCDGQGVKGYPTVLLFRDGARWEMKAPRTADGLRETILKLKSAPVTQLGEGGQAALDKLLEPDGAVVFALAGAGAADPLAAEFEAAAAELQLVSTFAAAAGPDLPSQLAPHRGSVVKLSRGEPSAVFAPPSDGALPAALRAWLEAERFPALSVVERHNFFGMLSKDISLALAVVDPDPACASASDDAKEPPACEAEVTVQGPHGSEGLGAALRDIAYSRPPLDETGGNAYRFGLLDGLRWGKFLTEVVGIERGELPLVLLLRGGSTRSFLVGRGPHDEATVRRLLREGGNSAALRFEYTGMWGLPARLWRRLGDALPFLPLHLLDFLPPYSLAALAVLLGFGALIVLIGSVPLPDDAAEGGEDSKKED